MDTVTGPMQPLVDALNANGHVATASTASGSDDLVLALRALEQMRRRVETMNLLVRVFGVRAYQWATLMLAAGAWAYALVEPTAPRIIAAVLFTGMTHAPTWIVPLAKGSE